MKVLIVYDSPVISHESHNNCLQVGSNLIQKLLKVLIWFWYHQFALIADIEKVFLMISIFEEDRDMLQFLWLKYPVKEDSEIIQFN